MISAKVRLIGGTAIVVLGSLFAPGRAFALEDGLADKPPMGYNAYHDVGCAPSEQLLKRRADGLVASGMSALGYVYVNMDDGWMEKARDANGDLVAKAKDFPNGMKNLTDYIHSKGLKAGIYLTCGVKTYQNLPGSLGHEEQDANKLAEWGFDFLKYDYRVLTKEDETSLGEKEPTNRAGAKAENIKMSDALRNNKFGRRILFSMCEHGRSAPWSWASNYAHMWRTTTDIKDIFAGATDDGGWSFTKIVDEMVTKNAIGDASSGPGRWNDYDMLVVGLHGKFKWMGPGMTDLEYRSHFSLWALLSAPLLHGSDPLTMKPATKQILMNEEIIAIDQDALGSPAQRVKNDAQTEIWVKKIQNNALALGLFNRSAQHVDMTVTWADFNVSPETQMNVRDLWAKADLGPSSDRITRPVQSHELVVLKLTPLAGTPVGNTDAGALGDSAAPGVADDGEADGPITPAQEIAPRADKGSGCGVQRRGETYWEMLALLSLALVALKRRR